MSALEQHEDEFPGEINLTIHLVDADTKMNADVTVNIFDTDRLVIERNAMMALRTALTKMGILEA